MSLFVIVLLHEFGHALACRQVGGTADQIVLWPLGGIAFVRAPARPGALLWSIAAGPLVNLMLVPVTVIPYVMLAFSSMGDNVNPDLKQYLFSLAFINMVLLIFNMLPIYPLDGGQIVQALLWFAIGRVQSLLVVSVIGMVVGGIVLVLALVAGQIWFTVLAVFCVFRSFVGFQQARAMARILNAPKHEDVSCPSCGAAPNMGDFWECEKCHARFDLFAEHGICPGCGNRFAGTVCPSCGEGHPMEDWYESDSDLKR